LNFEWKRVGVMDSDSGDDGTDQIRQELSWVEKREQKNDEDLVDGMRQAILFEKQGDAYTVTFKEEDGGRERVTEDEEYAERVSIQSDLTEIKFRR